MRTDISDEELIRRYRAASARLEVLKQKLLIIQEQEAIQRTYAPRSTVLERNIDDAKRDLFAARRAALDEICWRHDERIDRIARKYFLYENDAEDFAQMMKIEMISAINKKFNPERGVKFATFFFSEKHLHNRWVDDIRKYHDQRNTLSLDQTESEDSDESLGGLVPVIWPNPPDIVIHCEQVDNFIETLTEREYQIVALVDVEDWHAIDVADELGIEIGVVYYDRRQAAAKAVSFGIHNDHKLALEIVARRLHDHDAAGLWSNA